MSKLMEQSTPSQTATAGKKRGRKPPIPNTFFNGTRKVSVPLHSLNEHTVTMGALQEPFKIPSLRNKPISKVSTGKLVSSDTEDFVWVERRRTPAPLVSCPSSECSWEEIHRISGNVSYSRNQVSDFEAKGFRFNGKAPMSWVHEFDSVLPISCYPETGKINFTPLSGESSKQNIRDTGINYPLSAKKVTEKSTCQGHLTYDDHPCISSGEEGEKSLAASQFANDSCTQLSAMESAPPGYEWEVPSKYWHEAKQQRKNKLKVNGGRSWICRLPEVNSTPNDNIAIPPETTWPKTPSANPNPRSHASNTVRTLLATASGNCMSKIALPCNKGLITTNLSIGNINNEERTWSLKNEEQILRRKWALGVQNSMPKFVTEQNCNLRPTQRINVQQNNCRCGMVQTANPIAIQMDQGSPQMFYAATTPSLSPYGFVPQQALVSAIPYQLGSNYPYAQQQQYFYPSESPRPPQFYEQKFLLQQSKGYQKLYMPLTFENLAIHNRASIEYYNSPKGVMIGFRVTNKNMSNQ